MSLFFFQAEDGIRDLVRSRGLGDVYKRQPMGQAVGQHGLEFTGDVGRQRVAHLHGRGQLLGPVSYTHLTLPTSDLV